MASVLARLQKMGKRREPSSCSYYGWDKGMALTQRTLKKNPPTPHCWGD